MGRKIFVFFFLLIVVSSNALSKNVLVGTLLSNKKRFNKIIIGIKLHSSNIKIVNLLEYNAKINIILTEKYYLEQALKYKKPIFLLTDSFEDLTISSPYIKKIIFLTTSIDSQIKYSFKIMDENKTLAIVVHNKKIYNHLLKLKFKRLKIFYVRNIGEVPYLIDVALRKTDALLAIPDSTVYNYFSIQFIFKKAVLMGKYIIGFSRNMLELGAYAVVVPNYIQEGCRICKLILNVLKNRRSKICNKVIYPKNIIVVKNKNFSHFDLSNKIVKNETDY